MTRTHNIWILLGAAGKKIRKGSFLSVSRAFLGESWTRCGCLTADPAGNRWRRQPSDTTERETEKTFGCEIRHADLKFLYIVLIAKWFVTVFYTILWFCVRQVYPHDPLVSIESSHLRLHRHARMSCITTKCFSSRVVAWREAVPMLFFQIRH